MLNKISVIIINYNTSEILKDCLENLFAIHPTLEVIVTDNKSPDDSVAMVNTNFPQVKLIALNENKGIAFASNLALKHVTNEYILYLGSDAFPTKETLEGIVSYLDSNTEVGAATCKLLLPDGSLDMDAHRGFPTVWTSFAHFSGLDKIFKGSKLFDRYFLGYEDLNTTHEIDLCISHFLFVRKSVQEQVGAWDEDYFVYGEDVDMCYRIKQAGYKIIYLHQFEAKHLKGVSVGIRKNTQNISKASIETKRLMARKSAEAMLIFYNKHMKKHYPFFITWLVTLGIKLMIWQRVRKYN